MHFLPLTTLPGRLFARGREVLPGLLVAAMIAVVATGIGKVVPLVGSAIPAVVIGVLIAAWRKPNERLSPGVAYSGKFILQLAVVLLGSQLSLKAVAEVGLESLPVMLSSLVVALVAAWFLGRRMGIDRDTRTLIGVGTAICGASAVAAVAPVIKARSSQISYAISTVFLFNLIAVLTFPFIGHALDMTPHAFGLFAGTAVNDTSSVVAAAGVFSSAALGFAVVVKLVRTLMIVPITVGLAVLEARREGSGERMGPAKIMRLVPWFLIGFLLMVGVTSTGVFTTGAADWLATVSVFLIATALAGIGMSTDLAAIRTAGLRPLALGGILSLLVASTALAVMALQGHF